MNFLDNYSATNYKINLVKMSDGSFSKPLFWYDLNSLKLLCF